MRSKKQIITSMNWIALTEEQQLEVIKEQSTKQSIVIFKHSVRCSTSIMIKNRLERQELPEGISFYYLDLIRYRDISNKIAADFAVYHESPQVLVIKNGECIYDESHMAITMEDIKEQAA